MSVSLLNDKHIVFDCFQFIFLSALILAHFLVWIVGPELCLLEWKTENSDILKNTLKLQVISI